MGFLLGLQESGHGLLVAVAQGLHRRPDRKAAYIEAVFGKGFLDKPCGGLILVLGGHLEGFFLQGYDVDTVLLLWADMVFEHLAEVGQQDYFSAFIVFLENQFWSGFNRIKKAVFRSFKVFLGGEHHGIVIMQERLRTLLAFGHFECFEHGCNGFFSFLHLKMYQCQGIEALRFLSFFDAFQIKKRLVVAAQIIMPHRPSVEVFFFEYLRVFFDQILINGDQFFVALVVEQELGFEAAAFGTFGSEL